MPALELTRLILHPSLPITLAFGVRIWLRVRGITAHRIKTSDELILAEGVAITASEILFSRGREDVDRYGRISVERAQEIPRKQVKGWEFSDCARF